MKGETLIEVLIALTIAVVIITAIAILGVSALNDAQFIKAQNQSTKYAQEGMEVVRRIRNNDYANFQTYTDTYCLAKGSTTLGPACTTRNVDNIFNRTVTILQDGCGTDLTRVTVAVAWRDGKCTGSTTNYCHSSDLTSCFSTIQPIPAP